MEPETSLVVEAAAQATPDVGSSADARIGGHPSAGSLRGLDWLNFLLADVQTGVGPFLAIYLAAYGWNEERVGLALTIGGIAGIASQAPAGALVDRLRSKRARGGASGGRASRPSDPPRCRAATGGSRRSSRRR